jgi:hypothetical protein
MSRINTGRVILAGLAAAVVMNVLGFLANGVILASRWNDSTKALGVDVVKTAAQGVTGWVLMGLAVGLAIAWITAAIRPRFTGGAATGVRAGFAAWVILEAGIAAAYNGLYPGSLLIQSSIAGLVSTLAAGAVAGAIYRDA